jgi:histidine triad (HIT) family protein
MQDSIFTKIIKGELPSHGVYEDDKTLAFMDINPVQPGHVVVVPKVQVASVWELKAEDYHALMETVNIVGKRLQNVFPERQRIGVMIEGLGVKDHAHVNVFPFDTAAQFRHLPASGAEPNHATLAEIAAKLRTA